MLQRAAKQQAQADQGREMRRWLRGKKRAAERAEKKERVVLEQRKKKENERHSPPSPKSSTVADIAGVENNKEKWKLKRAKSMKLRKIGDWEEMKDPDSGSVYYYNHATNITQWEIPPEFENTTSSGGGNDGSSSKWSGSFRTGNKADKGKPMERNLSVGMGLKNTVAWEATTQTNPLVAQHRPQAVAVTGDLQRVCSKARM
jgi:hypothetical protein